MRFGGDLGKKRLFVPAFPVCVACCVLRVAFFSPPTTPTPPPTKCSNTPSRKLSGYPVLCINCLILLGLPAREARGG